MLSRTRLTGTLLVLLVASLAAPGHAAQGINLSWSNCFGEGFGSSNRNFACTSNSGTNLMVGSFQLAADLPQVIGTEIILNLASASPTLPAWWDFKNTGSCRSTALNANFLANPGDVICQDWSQGFSVGGIGAYCTLSHQCVSAPSGANEAIIKLINAVPQQNAMDLVANTEYFDFNLVFNNTKTVGTGACAGCLTPVCIVLNSINVVDIGNLHPRFLSTPTVPGSNFVTWQGGGSPTTPRGNGCPAATASQKSTWGSVKSLYR